jgi:signal recognition particle subunit SRP54
MKDDFTLDDFRKQFEQMAKLNDRDTIGRVPGMAGMVREGEDPKVAMRRVAKMIDAMTPEERREPDRIDEAARVRIAGASDTEPHEVEQFLAQFAQVRDLMRQLARMSFWQRLKLVLGFGKWPKSGDR